MILKLANSIILLNYQSINSYIQGYNLVPLEAIEKVSNRMVLFWRCGRVYNKLFEFKRQNKL